MQKSFFTPRRSVLQLFRVVALGIISQVASVSSVFAQAEIDTTLYEMSLEDLMQITVTTASKSSENIQSAPAIISIITAKEIETYGAITLSDVMERLTSTFFMSTYFSPEGMIAMRSTQTELYNTKVLILLDGRPLRESFHGGYNGVINNMFPIERIDRLEVIRGPGSVLYGTGAYVGVINIVTKKGNTGFAATIRYGQFNTKQANLSYGKQKNGFDIATGINLLKSDGWDFNARGESDVIRDKMNTYDSVFRPIRGIQREVEGISGVLKIGYKGLSINTFAATNDWATMNRLPVWPNPIDYRIRNHRYLVDATYEKKIMDSWTTSLSVTYNAFKYRAYNSSKADDYFRRNSNDVLVELTNYIKPTEKINIVLGGLLNSQSGEGIDTGYDPNGNPVNIDSAPNENPWHTVPKYSYSWYAAYLQADYTPVKQVKLIAGAQLNKIDGIDVNFSPRFGAILSANENLGLKLLYGNAFRSPAAFERYGKSPLTVVGNSELKPEQMRTIETQLFYNTANMSLALTYFNNHDDSNITRRNLAQVINGVQFAQVYVNSGYTDVNGFEFEGKYNLKSFVLQGSFTYQTSKNNLDQEDYTGIPKFMAKTGVIYNAKNYGSIALWNSFYTKPEDYYLRNAEGVILTKMANDDVDAFNYLTANVIFNVKEILSLEKVPGLTLHILVNNVLDSRIYFPELVRRNINSLPGRPGRSVYAGLTLKI